MKFSSDSCNVTCEFASMSPEITQDQLKYETPSISLMSLASVIAGPGGSQLDDDWVGNKTSLD